MLACVRVSAQNLASRADEVAELDASLAPQIAGHLHKLMFHKDCGKHIEACELIQGGLDEYREEMGSNMDRLLHWLSLRMADGNTTCLLRTLDLIGALFADLDASDTVLNDYEASIILPALAEKSGHNQDRIRQKYRELFIAAANISRHVKVSFRLSAGSSDPRHRDILNYALIILLRHVPLYSRCDGIIALLVFQYRDRFPPEDLSTYRNGRTDAVGRSLDARAQVVDALVEGTRSKNNRSRVECVEEMGCIVQRHGVGSLKTTGKEKVLPLVAKLVGERDKALRGAALSTLAVVYTSEGDAIWKQLGTLSAPQQSLIEDRFRFTEKEVLRAGGVIGATREQRLLEREAAAEPAGPTPAAASPVAAVPPAAAPGTHMAAAFASPALRQPAAASIMQSMDFPQHVRAARDDAIMRDSVAVGAMPPPATAAGLRAAVPASPMLQGTPNGTAPATPLGPEQRTDSDITEQWARGMVLLHSARLPDAVEGMKVLCYELMEASRGSCSPDVAAVFGDAADELVTQLTSRVDQVSPALLGAVHVQ